MVSEPEQMGSWYALTGFAATVIPFKIALYYTDTFPLSLGIGLIGGLMAYLVILLYMYHTVKFHIKF
jgi:hypothetical protein